MPRRTGVRHRRRRVHRREVLLLVAGAGRVAVTVAGQLLLDPAPVRNAAAPGDERLRERPVPQRERRQRPHLGGEQPRVVEGAAQDEPRHRVDVRRHRLAAEPHRLQRNRPAAGKRIKHARRPPPERRPDFPPETPRARLRARPPARAPSAGCRRRSPPCSPPFPSDRLTTAPAIRSRSSRRPSSLPGSGSSVASSAARLAANGRRAGQMCSVEMCPCRTFFSCTESSDTCRNGNPASISRVSPILWLRTVNHGNCASASVRNTMADAVMFNT